MNLSKLGQLAVDVARKQGASYADFRFEEIRNENIEVSDGKPGQIDRNSSAGFCVRVLADGAWGFAANAVIGESEVRQAAQTAVAIAKTSARINRKKVHLADVPTIKDKYSTPFDKDPFKIPLTEKIEYLLSLDAMMRKNESLNNSGAFMSFTRTNKLFISSLGSEIEQTLLQSGAGASCGVIRGHRDRTERSYPSSSGQYKTIGYELVDELKFEENLPRIADEAVMLSLAKECPSGEFDIVLSSDLLSLQIHETIGHPLELDRVFGSERNFSGTSFAIPVQLGELKYGSDLINVVADTSYRGGLATWGYDDEGVKARPFKLIENGILVNYLSNRESAYRIGKLPTGAANADGWSNPPIVRITNVLLEPGESSFDDLISGIDDGIYFDTVESWSIGDDRSTFQLGSEVGWEIKGGKLGEMIKRPVYSGNTVYFWNSCDAVGDKSQWIIWGTPNCGKGQPAQTAQTAQGCSPSRFRRVRVGVEHG